MTPFIFTILLGAVGYLATSIFVFNLSNILTRIFDLGATGLFMASYGNILLGIWGAIYFGRVGKRCCEESKWIKASTIVLAIMIILTIVFQFISF